MERRWDPLWAKLCFRQSVSVPNIDRSFVQMSCTSSPVPATLPGGGKPPAMPGLCLLIISWIPPVCAPGFSQTPHYFQSPSLVKSNLATYYRSDKTALGSAGPDEGPGSFSNFHPPSSVRGPLSLGKAAERAGRSQPQLAAFAKGQEF